jgi:hypothetical protein
MTTRSWSICQERRCDQDDFGGPRGESILQRRLGCDHVKKRRTVRSDSPSCVSSVEGSRPPARTRARWNRTSPSPSTNTTTDAPISNRYLWLGSCIQSSTIYSARSFGHPCRAPARLNTNAIDATSKNGDVPLLSKKWQKWQVPLFTRSGIYPHFVPIWVYDFALLSGSCKELPNFPTHMGRKRFAGSHYSIVSLTSDSMRPAECKRALKHVSLDGLTLVPLPVALSTALNK